MSRGFVISSLLLTFLILWGVPALAQAQSVGGCTIIDKPGSYALESDITATMEDLQRFESGLLGCILIVADFVNLDLQGHTITGPAVHVQPYLWGYAGIKTAADASGKAPTAVHIRNGCVKGFELGVALDGKGHLVEQMRVTGNNVGISFASHGSRGDGIRVKDVVAVSNDYGIFFYAGYGGSVENCQLISNRYYGIYQNYNPPINPHPLGTRIVGNTVSGNGMGGIYAFCPSLILQNMAYSNGSGPQDNIVVSGPSCTMSDNNPVPVVAPAP